MKSLLKLIIPNPALNLYYSLRSQINNFRILAFKYNQFNTIKNKVPLDSNNKQIPWYTYPAIEFLKQLDTSEKNIFEWGAGNSSIFWSRKSKSVISIEDNKKWYNKVIDTKLGNQQILYIEDKDNYINSIQNSNNKFDIIIIDGHYRFECTLKTVNYLVDGGIIILDNSDWFPKCTKYLRDNKFIQVDFFGFGPTNGFTWVTSIFFNSDYNFKSINNNQPAYCIGGLKKCADE